MKNILLVIVAVIPSKFLRVSLYLLPGCKIDFGSRVGMFTVINVRKCTIRKARVVKRGITARKSLEKEKG